MKKVTYYLILILLNPTFALSGIDSLFQGRKIVCFGTDNLSLTLNENKSVLKLLNTDVPESQEILNDRTVVSDSSITYRTEKYSLTLNLQISETLSYEGNTFVDENGETQPVRCKFTNFGGRMKR